MPQPYDTLHRSLPPSTQATVLRKETKNCGNTLRRYTRTQTKASRAVVKTGEYRLCPHQVPCTRHTPHCRCHPWTEGSLDTTSMAATAVVAARRSPQMLHVSPILDQTAATTTAVPYTQTMPREAVTMTWSSRNEKCTKGFLTHTTTRLHRTTTK